MNIKKPKMEMITAIKLCDICGKTCETEHPTKDDHVLHFETGYGSEFDNIGVNEFEDYNIDLCDNCFRIHALPIFLKLK